MNSLHKLSVYGIKAAAALMIISSIALVTAAQTIAPLSQGKMYGEPGFRGEPINLNVVNADIRDILNYITEQYGINFVIDKSVKEVPVTVNVNEVPWNVALDSILRAQELGVQVNGSILRVSESRSLAAEGEILRNQRDTQLDSSPLYTEFIRLNYARAAGSMAKSSTSTGTSSNLSGGGMGSGMGASAQGGGDGLLPIIKRRLSRRGSVETDSRSNSLIITDVRENIDAVRQLVAILDQPEPQVEIEARIVVATRSFSRDLGVALSALVLGPRGSGASGASVPGSELPQDGGGGGNRQNTTGFRPGGIPVGIGMEPSTNLLSSIPNTVIGLTTGIFGTAQISALITAGEQKGNAKTIATPRVSALNNRQAEIKNGIKIPITTVQPGSEEGIALVATTEYVDVPLRLQITPQITDLGTVILNVVAENSSLAGGGVINTQSVTTEVMVPDGGTTVVGGVLSDDERENQDRTPGLSKIPFLGNLFKRKGTSRDTAEVLFFITPRIMRPEVAAAAGQSGVKASGTILQPVPLGNPASNSQQVTSNPALTPAPSSAPTGASSEPGKPNQ